MTSLLLMLLSIMALQAQTFKVATYNLRYYNEDKDGKTGNMWEVRSPYIAQLVHFYGFDIFGTQEGLYNQLQDLKAMLPEYEYIGVGRTDGKKAGEHSAIFYRPDKFELLEKGNFWLSEKPDKPTKGWGATQFRICTWGKFRDKKTGFTFYHYNLHTDTDERPRLEASKLLMKKVKEISGQEPVILTGDYNDDQHSELYRVITGSGLVSDAYETAEFRYAPNGTFNAFRTDDWKEERIDHVFLSKQFKAKRYGVLTQTYRTFKEHADKEGNSNFPKEVWMQEFTARNMSDHFPVVVVVEEQ